jgi:hypothetical protein
MDVNSPLGLITAATCCHPDATGSKAFANFREIYLKELFKKENDAA